ncbi:Alpha/Beta hydrolase protein [Suillus discolor]|uniref:Alpha/Beta hydrolase protein n=1 Tax=Suillus discolor TaxID=1912936 RepID=A0A9P7F1A6_9AGAM|nr:Alpha/Beta hydrolase protein [Suillus discolor]KAG2100380.1 Alpha/Beta hydrolase protein [Suillus discolor]
MPSETPFQINIPDEKLRILRAKLELATFPNELQGIGWNHGPPLADMKRLVERWKNGYDWRKYEKELNQELPMFIRDIDVDGFGALNIHYVHKKSETVDAIPLLFCHGWPGSFIEIREILSLLTASSPKHPSFHVVALSLPGFGFSEGAHKPGFGLDQYAEVTHKLMVSLGYNEYVTQGGDWGFVVTRRMAAKYGGKHVKAWHTNFPMADPPTWKSPLSFLSYLLNPYSAEEKAGFERTAWYRNKGSGYFVEQRSFPQTLAYSLTDSPVALLAWIYEKLVTWTDDYKWTDDQVLTWISIYWFSRAGPGAAHRIYSEVYSDFYDIGRTSYPTIPLGVSYYPKELLVFPSAWFRRVNNVVIESYHKTGGHFAASERPEELVEDVRKMFAKGGPAFAIVPGKSGYA